MIDAAQADYLNAVEMERNARENDPNQSSLDSDVLLFNGSSNGNGNGNGHINGNGHHSSDDEEEEQEENYENGH